ncbi:hypothetical protein AVEN_204785-1, partial [Araneus ventricosus]
SLTATSLASRYFIMHLAISLQAPLAGVTCRHIAHLFPDSSFVLELVMPSVPVPSLAFIDHQRLALAHISVIREPGGKYVGHVTPASGTGCDIFKYILKYLEDNDVDINEQESIGFKGTVTNTGSKAGVIRNI